MDLASLSRFYKNLPKGAAPPPPPAKGLLGRYRAKYLDDQNASAAPILHVMLFVGLVGYYMDYQKHLKFHKHAQHH